MNFDFCSSRAQEDAKKYIFLKSNGRYQNGKPLAIQRSSVKVKLSSYFLTGAFQKKTKQNETPCISLNVTNRKYSLFLFPKNATHLCKTFF